MNKVISEYFKEIGRRGGKAGKGKPKHRDTEEVRRNAAKAARIRWEKVQGQKQVEVD